MQNVYVKKGFTIVELIIAIVVVGILAAISLMAYNGIQERAEDTRILTVINSFKKSMTIYKTLHGKFPKPASSHTCIGEISDYPAISGTEEGRCGWGVVDEGFNEALRSVSSSRVPDGSFAKHKVQGSSHRGMNVYVYPDGQKVDVIYIETPEKECLEGFSFNGGGGPTHKQCSFTYS